MQIERHIVEAAMHNADVEDDFRWDATGAIRGVYSPYCFAVTGRETDFARFFGMLLREMAEESGEFPTEGEIEELADSVVVDSMGKAMIFGFAGIKVV